MSSPLSSAETASGISISTRTHLSIPFSSTQKPESNHIAPIKLGGSQVTVSSSLRKRPHASLEDDNDNDVQKHPEPQLLTGFDSTRGGAITVDDGRAKSPKLLVIPKVQARDWRRGATNKFLQHEVQVLARSNNHDVEDEANEDGVYGLVSAKTTGPNNSMAPGSPTSSSHEGQEGAGNQMTEDERAIQALMGRGNDVHSSLVIKHASSGRTGHQDDLRSYRSDVASRPDSATLANYAAIPVEEFGAALLRGMGWKDGQEFAGTRRYGESGQTKTNGQHLKIPDRRPALLGIGAKEMPEGLEEPGAWGKGTKVDVKGKGQKKRLVQQVYNPIMLKNKKTGELISEEDLRKKKEEAEAEAEAATRHERDGDTRKPKRRSRSRSVHRHDHRSHHAYERGNSSDSNRYYRSNERRKKTFRHEAYHESGSLRRSDRERSRDRPKDYGSDESKRRSEHHRRR